MEYNLKSTAADKTDTEFRGWNLALTTTRASVGLLQIVIGIYLGYAVYTMKKCVGNNNELNSLMLCVHASTFGAYMVSILIYYVFYLNYYTLSKED